MIDQVQRDRVVDEAIRAVAVVDERIADVMTTLRDCDGVVHMVVVDVDGAFDEYVASDCNESRLHLSPNYSVMTVVIAACSLLQQAAIMLRSARNSNLDDHIDVVDTAVEQLSDKFDVDLSKFELRHNNPQ